MSASPPLGHRLEFAAVRGAAALHRALPGPALRLFYAAAAALAYDGLRIRRRLTEQNLRRAFPDRDESWIRRTARRAYAHLARESMETLALSHAGAEEILARTEVHGLDQLHAALAEGRGVVGSTGHLGNWEILVAALAVRGEPVSAIVQRQSNPLVNDLITRTRAGWGIHLIERKRAPSEGLRALRSGRVVGFAADQDAKRHGVFVPFFGRPASTHRGAALLALRAGAPVFLAAAIREGDRWVIHLERVPLPARGDLGERVEQLTARFTAGLEQRIRDHPEQYLWLHDRWRTRPEEPARARQV